MDDDVGVAATWKVNEKNFVTAPRPPTTNDNNDDNDDNVDNGTRTTTTMTYLCFSSSFTTLQFCFLIFFAAQQRQMPPSRNVSKNAKSFCFFGRDAEMDWVPRRNLFFSEFQLDLFSPLCCKQPNLQIRDRWRFSYGLSFVRVKDKPTIVFDTNQLFSWSFVVHFQTLTRYQCT